MTSIQAYIGFSQHNAAPVAPGETTVPGYPDNRVMPIACAIADAREAPSMSLDEQGFTLARHETAFAGERDLEVLRRGYHDETAAFLTSFLDASLVVPARAGILVRDGRRLIGDLVVRMHVRRRHEIDLLTPERHWRRGVGDGGNPGGWHVRAGEADQSGRTGRAGDAEQGKTSADVHGNPRAMSS